MKVTYKFSNIINEGKLIYRKNESSFDFISNLCGDISIVIGYLQLTINSSTNQLVSVWGLHPYYNWIKEDLVVPQFDKGIVKLENNYISAISYNEEEFTDWKTYCDKKNGWICIGEKNTTGVTIMFATDCLVVITDKKLKALWLKPKFE